MTSDDAVHITVDGRRLSVPTGTLLWEACRGNGIDIPIFCYHTKLGPVGACRTCLVELEGNAKGPITACSTPVTDGMVVRTKSPIAERAQRGILEFLLLNHPLDCPICDRGGECPLQDQVFAYGPGTSRYIEPKRHHDKPIALGPTIALDRERCVLCWRCVRFCSEIAEDKSIILLDRGDHSMVGTFKDEPYASNFSGNVIELCPVGALTSRQTRFRFRPWELQNRPSICPHCPMGCNINVSVRKNDEVKRILSRDNPEVDDSWLCDRGRFDFEFIGDAGRLQSPMIRRGDSFVQVSWSEALAFVASRVKAIVEESGSDAVAGIASPRLTNEDLFVFKRFVRDSIGSTAFDHFPRSALDFAPGRQRMLDGLDRRLMPISGLNAARTILLLGADPSSTVPVMELRIRQAVNKFGAKLVVVHPNEIALTGKAGMSLSYAPETFSATVRALTAAVIASRGQSQDSPTGGSTDARILSQYAFMEGPIAVLYDDSFADVLDKGEALDALGTLVDTLAADLEVGTMPMLEDCNSMGARDLGLVPSHPVDDIGSTSVVEHLLRPGNTFRALFVQGPKLVGEGSDERLAECLSGLDLLVVSELKMTPTARLAHVVLPAASFAEKDGTFTNIERRVQQITKCVPSPGIARPDWEILVDLSQYFDTPLDYSTPEHVWQDIRASVGMYAGLSYIDLGPHGVRPAALQLA